MCLVGINIAIPNVSGEASHVIPVNIGLPNAFAVSPRFVGRDLEICNLTNSPIVTIEGWRQWSGRRIGRYVIHNEWTSLGRGKRGSVSPKHEGLFYDIGRPFAAIYNSEISSHLSRMFQNSIAKDFDFRARQEPQLRQGYRRLFGGYSALFVDGAQLALSDYRVGRTDYDQQKRKDGIDVIKAGSIEVNRRDPNWFGAVFISFEYLREYGFLVWGGLRVCDGARISGWYLIAFGLIFGAITALACCLNAFPWV
jgi:hypothetical protein